MAAKDLEEIRNKLVDGLPEQVINGLLDDLKKECVLGNEEIEYIKQKMKTRTDQARDLIDGVWKKGDKASAILLNSLEKRDQHLYKSLNIGGHSEMAEPGATCSPATTGCTTDKPSSKNDEYKMESNPRGLCLIINNENFGDPKSKRNGSQKDVDTLKALFTRFGFQVEIKKDQSADQIQQLMIQYSEDHRHGDCFVCCVMSHGNKTGIVGSDGQICPLKDITSPFDGVNCPALIGKPKVFFIQACRGKEMQSRVVVTDGHGASRMQKPENVSYSISKDSDFLIVMSTMEGYVSIRHEFSGSWFIQSLCKHLEEGSKRGQDILRILTNVNDDVSREESTVEIKNDMVDAKMTPQPFFTLRKLLIFRAPKGKTFK